MKQGYKRPQFTPAKIDSLQPGEIFVFGSNLNGYHGGGAARAALDKFGAVWGLGVGLQGQSYAIPTMQGGPETIKPYVDQFIAFAKNNEDKTFLVTPIGCGIAGLKIKEIAPLFRAALQVDNIVLPKSFVDYLQPKQNIQLPDYLKTKIYGQTRTLVDMLIELNKKNNYTSADKALEDLWGYLETIRVHGDEVAFNCSLRSIYAFANSCFTNGSLDIEKLGMSLHVDFYDGINAVYENYVVEKSVTLISYLNDFRRYTSSDELKKDFLRVTGGVNHCGPNPEDYYFAFSHAYVKVFFDSFTTKFWREFTKNGVMDNQLFFDFMVGRHNRGIKKYGLDAVIKRNYEQDSPCHPEVYRPYRGGAGPVYVQTDFHNSNMEVVKRRFIKSCGEGRGPFGVRELFDFHRIIPLLEEDEKYTTFEKLYLPKNDVTLPVFHRWSGRVLFASQEEQKRFIEKQWEIMKR